MQDTSFRGTASVSVNESKTGVQLLDSPTSSPTPKPLVTPTSAVGAAARASLPGRSKSLFGSDSSGSSGEDENRVSGSRGLATSSKNRSSRRQGESVTDAAGGGRTEIVDVSETPLAAASVWAMDGVQEELLAQQRHVVSHQHQQQSHHLAARTPTIVTEESRRGEGTNDDDEDDGSGDPRGSRNRSGATFVAQPSVVVLRNDLDSDVDNDGGGGKVEDGVSGKLDRQRTSSECVIVDQNSAEHWGMARRFGFPQNTFDPSVCEVEQAAQPMIAASATLCEQQWLNALRGVPLLANAMPDTNEPLRRLARKYGVPPHIRGIMWLTLSGVALKMDENEGFCAKTLARNGYVEDDDGALIIEKDLERTFPNHPYFHPRGVGIIKLKHVLHALCWRNPLIGYCQSYNFIVAVLLLVFDDEESAFWMMVHIVEQLLPNDFYGEGLLGTKVDQEVVLGLLKEVMPKLHHHFEAIRFDVRALIPAWTMSLFINTFPIETVIRIWDLLFSQSLAPYGLPSTIPIAVLLAFFKLHVDELMKINDSGDMLVFLGKASAVMYDSAKLVKLATEVKVTPVTLHQMRRKYRAAVVGENLRRLNEKIKRQRQREAAASQAFVQSCANVTGVAVLTPETPTFVDPQEHLDGHRNESYESVDRDNDGKGEEMEMADVR